MYLEVDNGLGWRNEEGPILATSQQWCMKVCEYLVRRKAGKSNHDRIADLGLEVNPCRDWGAQQVGPRWWC